MPRFPNPLMLPAILAVLWMTPVAAQSEDYSEYDDGAGDIVILAPQQLDELVGPIALYPDDLLAIVLPASTYPLDIVQAARFLDKYEQDSSLQPNEDWDESVTALLNYPEVVRLMNDDIDWTWELGGAVLNQQPDLIAAIERFRDRAYAAGNLQSDDYQTVSNDGDAIEILPVEEEVIYVPYYEPREVIVRQIEPVYYYYPRPRPVYYYPYPAGHYFFNRSFWGVSTAYRIGWSSRRLNVWHYTFHGHPYFGHYYSGYRYRRPSINIYNTRYVNSSGRYASDRHRYGDRWRPRRRAGVRPVGDRPHRVHRDYPQRRPIVREQYVRRPASPSQTRDELRYRDRPNTVSDSTRRRTRTNNTVAEDIRRRTASTNRTEQNRPVARVRRAPAIATNNRPALRKPARSVNSAVVDDVRRRAASSSRAVQNRPATRVTRTPTVSTDDTPALRKPARPAQRPAAREQRRPDNRGDSDASEERQSRPAARQRTESRADRKPATKHRKQRY